MLSGATCDPIGRAINMKPLYYYPNGPLRREDLLDKYSTRIANIFCIMHIIQSYLTDKRPEIYEKREREDDDHDHDLLLVRLYSL